MREVKGPPGAPTLLLLHGWIASGALIFGPAPYWQPFTVTDTDQSGHTSLTENGQTGATAVCDFWAAHQQDRLMRWL